MGFKSLNKVQLIGNLTKDPELITTESGAKFCKFVVATNRNWTSVEGLKHEETEFHYVIAWEKLADICMKILSKGKQVWVEGRISTKRYVDKTTGIEKISVNIITDDVIALGTKNEGL